MHCPKTRVLVPNFQTTIPGRKMNTPSGYRQISLLWATREALIYTSVAEVEKLNDMLR
jgi:hypothetical protein